MGKASFKAFAFDIPVKRSSLDRLRHGGQTYPPQTMVVTISLLARDNEVKGVRIDVEIAMDATDYQVRIE